MGAGWGARSPWQVSGVYSKALSFRSRDVEELPPQGPGQGRWQLRLGGGSGQGGKWRMSVGQGDTDYSQDISGGWCSSGSHAPQQRNKQPKMTAF